MDQLEIVRPFHPSTNVTPEWTHFLFVFVLITGSLINYYLAMAWTPTHTGLHMQSACLKLQRPENDT
jgi:hypothetical protein